LKEKKELNKPKKENKKYSDVLLLAIDKYLKANNLYKKEEKKKERRAELANVNWLGNVSEGNMEYINFQGKRYGKSSYILTFPAIDGEFGVKVMNPNERDEKTTVFYCFGIHNDNSSGQN